MSRRRRSLAESQGSVLGPLLFVLYTAPLFNVVAQHQVDAHQYADELQLYLCVPPSEALVATDRLDACLVDVEAWLKASWLRLNPSKIQIMWLGSAQQSFNLFIASWAGIKK